MKTLPVTRSAIPQLRVTSVKSYSSRKYKPFVLLHFPPYKLPFFCLLFSKDLDQLAKSSWLEVTQPRARKQEESRFFYSSGLVKICKAWVTDTLGDVLCYAFNFPEEGYKCTWVSRRKFIGSVIFICLLSALMEKKSPTLTEVQEHLNWLSQEERHQLRSPRDVYLWTLQTAKIKSSKKTCWRESHTSVLGIC